jgi:hypothetical protein
VLNVSLQVRRGFRELLGHRAHQKRCGLSDLAQE